MADSEPMYEVPGSRLGELTDQIAEQARTIDDYRNEVTRLMIERDQFHEVLSSPAELARWVEIHHGDHQEWIDELVALLPRED